MIQDGKLFCDQCKQPIPIGVNPSIRVLVEFKKDSPDRHFCETYIPHVQNISTERAYGPG
jgi:hypothetical protein